MSSKASKKNAVSRKCADQSKIEYFKSSENLLRSLNVYSSHDVLGKCKCNNVRKAKRVLNTPNVVPISNYQITYVQLILGM